MTPKTHEERVREAMLAAEKDYRASGMHGDAEQAYVFDRFVQSLRDLEASLAREVMEVLPEITESNMGYVGQMNDYHKGKNLARSSVKALFERKGITLE